MSDIRPGTATPPIPAADRRVLVGGEQLRIAVEDAPSGGGDKYEPQTAEQARNLLLPMVHEVTRRAGSLPEHTRGARLYVESRLLPNYLAASHFPDALLRTIDAVPVGSRADRGTYRTAGTTSNRISPGRWGFCRCRGRRRALCGQTRRRRSR